MSKPVLALPKSAAPAAELALPITLRFLDRVHTPIAAQIRRVSTGFFVVSSPLLLKPEQRVQILFAGRAIDTQVLYCHPQTGDDFQLGLQMLQEKDQPLRTEPRIPVDMPGELNVAGLDSPIPAKLVNISGSGLGLEIDRQVFPGHMAYVKLGIGFAFGEIRHCSKLGNAYRAGLKLDEFITQADDAEAAKKRATSPEKPSALARLFGLKSSSRP